MTKRATLFKVYGKYGNVAIKYAGGYYALNLTGPEKIELCIYTQRGYAVTSSIREKVRALCEVIDSKCPPEQVDVSRMKATNCYFMIKQWWD